MTKVPDDFGRAPNGGMCVPTDEQTDRFVAINQQSQSSTTVINFKEAVAGFRASEETPEATVARLAGLSRFEYDRVREAEATRLRVRVTTLDKEVAHLRGDAAADAEKLQGRPLELPDPEPWHEPVNGAELLNDLVSAFACHLVLPRHADATLALWSLHTHVFERFEHTPRLVFTSPTMRSGKTQALRTLEPLVVRPLRSANVTPAAMFRVIELAKPTLLVDEVDSFAHENNELRGIINAGHERGGQVTRTSGDEHEPRSFNVFAPLAIASIGKIWETVNDRGIGIGMRRRKKSESIVRLTPAARKGLAELGRRCARWGADHGIGLEAADPSMPETLGDRDCDNWRGLFAIADLCGGAWPDRARQAALALAAGAAGDEQAENVQLLGDIRVIFEEEAADRIASDELAATLGRMEERPWPEWKAGKPITTRQLAALLRPFGIHPTTMRLDDGRRLKGYKLEAFLDVFERYLEDSTLRSVTPLQVADSVAFSPKTIRDTTSDVTDRKALKVADSLDCHAVTDRKAQTGANGNSDASDEDWPELPSFLDRTTAGQRWER